ncbi:MAG: pyridoxamine 5'-phosphate oxidase [Myxococcota bacterium]
MKVHEMRRAYKQFRLSEADVAADPLTQFATWFRQARETQGTQEANAMTLATASADGVPSARIVLLKAVHDGAFRFYTNLDSRKGVELRENPRAALVFFWPWLEQQVRVSGVVHLLPRSVVSAYFTTRPRMSRIGAHTSPQSAVIPDRDALVVRRDAVEQRFAGQEDIPPPDRWGGFALTPSQLEFWQGRPGRLHDRLRYVREADGRWRLERLAP